MYSNPTSLHAPFLKAINLPWSQVLNLAFRIRAPGKRIFAQPRPCLDFFYLDTGRMQTTHEDANGKGRINFRFGPGNLFNEAVAAAGVDAPDSPFFCITDCVIYRFPHALLRDAAFVVQYPHLIVNLMRGLGLKLLMLHTSLADRVSSNAVAQIGRFLYSLSRRAPGRAIDPGLTQEDLALLLGMHRGTVVRALHELRECGAIRKFSKHCLEIGDVELLRQIAVE